MLARGLTGEKAGQGFYKRVKSARRRVADPRHRSGDARVPARSRGRSSRALAAAESVTDTGERIAKLFNGSDRVGEFLRADARADARLHRQGHARDRPLARRRRSRDALGVRLGARAVRDHRRDRRSSGCSTPRGPPTRAARSRRAPLLARACVSGRPAARRLVAPAAPACRSCGRARSLGIVKTNPGASLVDLGDGVLASSSTRR